MKLFSMIFSVFALVAASQAFADTQVPADLHQGLQAAYDLNTDLITVLQGGMQANDLKALTQKTLNGMVSEGIQLLRDVGDTSLANTLESEWNTQFSSYLVTYQITPFELGDHEPLSPWLANFYQTLNTESHGIIRASQLASDINTMNYALGVVLRPNGAWRTHTDYDRIEYRKHFIPMCDIITYWGSLELCKAETKGDPLGYFCGDAATKLETLMGRYVAPDMSDWVWARVSGEQNSTPAPALQGQFASEQDFENAVLN